MKLTKYWIRKWQPCLEAIEWAEEQDTRDVFELIERLKKLKRYDWIIWAIPRLLKTKRDRVRFAVYSARLVLHNFEKKYPDDKRPRQAIQAGKAWVKNPTIKNQCAARSAAWSAWSAARSAESAAWSAWSAARSAESAAWSAWSAARSAAWSAAETITKIINYGIKLLRG